MDQLASGNALICGKYQDAYGLMGRLGVDIPPVLDTVSSSCSHKFILDRPVLSIVHDFLAPLLGVVRCSLCAGVMTLLIGGAVLLIIAAFHSLPHHSSPPCRLHSSSPLLAHKVALLLHYLHD